jgi:hypothetical protein
MNRFFQSMMRLLVFVFLVGTVPAQIWAHNAAGRIIGNVTDPTGASDPRCSRNRHECGHAGFTTCGHR